MDTTFIISVIVILALALLMSFLLVGVNALLSPRRSGPARHIHAKSVRPEQGPDTSSSVAVETEEELSVTEEEIVSVPEDGVEETVFDSDPVLETVPETQDIPVPEIVPDTIPEIISEPALESVPEPSPVLMTEPDPVAVPQIDDSGILVCDVVSNHNVGKYYKELRVRIPEGRNFRFRSGEYINIHAPAGTVDFSSMEIDKRFQWDWKDEKLYDLNVINPEEVSREYTILSYPGEMEEGEDGSTVIKFLVRLALPESDGVQPGVCSSYIFSLKPGDKVRLSGPLGETVMLKDVPHEREFVFICGGAGISMMRSYVLSLLKGDKSTRKICCYYGTDVFADAFYIDEFRALEREFPSFRFRLVLEIPDMEAIMNGVDFDQGYVHQAVYDNYLKTHKSPQLPLYFVCGPQDMVAATRDMLATLNVPVENIIGDGFSGEE